MSAGKRGGDYGGAEVFSNDMIITQGPGQFILGSFRSFMAHYFVNFICLLV